MIEPLIQQSQPDSLVNQTSAGGMTRRVAQAIRDAAAKTGVDFSYLVNKASQESGFDTNAEAATSSATGLFQFTKQTWLSMVKNYGDKYGLTNYADHISLDSSGVAHVTDPTWRQAILGLRKDPQVSAVMSCELDKQNLESLKTNVGGKISGTELYLAHFLGASGASDFINEMRNNPGVSGADVLPSAAAANPSVFYSNAGEPRSLDQIYKHFAQKFDQTPMGTMVASREAPSAPPASATASASAYAVAGISTYASRQVTGTFTDGSSTPHSAHGSTLFDTMVLAQMNAPNIPLAMFQMSNSSDHNKKSAESIWGTNA